MSSEYRFEKKTNTAKKNLSPGYAQVGALHRTLYTEHGSAEESIWSSCVAHSTSPLPWAKSHERCAWYDCAAQCVFKQPQLFDTERAEAVAVLLAVLQSLPILLNALFTRTLLSSLSRDGKLTGESASSHHQALGISPRSIVHMLQNPQSQRRAPMLCDKLTSSPHARQSTRALGGGGIDNDLDSVGRTVRPLSQRKVPSIRFGCKIHCGLDGVDDGDGHTARTPSNQRQAICVKST